MRIEKDEHSGWMLLFGKDSFAYIENDWAQLLGNWNWKTYRLADIYYENDVHLGAKVFQFVLLGLGFHVRINNPDHPGYKELDALAEEVRESIKNER